MDETNLHEILKAENAALHDELKLRENANIRLCENLFDMVDQRDKLQAEVDRLYAKLAESQFIAA